MKYNDKQQQDKNDAEIHIYITSRFLHLCCELFFFVKLSFFSNIFLSSVNQNLASI